MKMKYLLFVQASLLHHASEGTTLFMFYVNTLRSCLTSVSVLNFCFPFCLKSRITHSHALNIHAYRPSFLKISKHTSHTRSLWSRSKEKLKDLACCMLLEISIILSFILKDFMRHHKLLHKTNGLIYINQTLLVWSFCHNIVFNYNN